MSSELSFKATSKFKWLFVQRVQDEFETLVNLRKESNFIEGVREAERGNTDFATVLLQNYVNEHQTDWLGHYLLGELQMYHLFPADKKSAEKSFDKSYLAKSLGNLNAYYQKGKIAMEKNQLKEANGFLAAAVSLCYKSTINKYSILSDEEADTDNIILQNLQSSIDPESFVLFGISGFDRWKKEKPEIWSQEIIMRLSICLIEENLSAQQAIWFLRKLIEINPTHKVAVICEILVRERINDFLDQKEVETAFNIAKNLNNEERKLIPKCINSDLVCLTSDTTHTGKCIGFCWYMKGSNENYFSHYEKASIYNQNSTTFLIKVCQQLINIGEFEKCESTLNKFVERNKNKSAYYFYGQFLLAQNNKENAIDKFCSAIGHFDGVSELNDIPIYLIMIRTNNDIQQFTQAQIKQKQSVKLIDDHGSMEQKELFHLEVIRSLFGLNDLPNALQEARNLQKLNDSIKQNNIILSILNLEKDDFIQIKQIYEKHLNEEEQVKLQLYYKLGMIILQDDPDDKSGQVEKLFRKQIEIQSNHKSSKFELAKIFTNRGDFQHALSLIQGVYNLDKQLEETQYEIYSQLLFKMRKFEEYVEVLVQFESKFSKRQEELSLQIGLVSLYQIKNSDIALKYFSKYLSVTKSKFLDKIQIRQQCKIQFRVASIGLSNLSQKNVTKHIFTLNQVVKLFHDMWECYFEIAAFHLSKKEYGIAQKFLNKGFSFNPTHVKGLINAANIQIYSEKKHKAAVKLLKQSLLVCDQLPWAFVLLGKAYRKLKKLEKSIACLRNAMYISKNQEITQIASLLLGYSLFEMGQFKEASQLFYQIRHVFKQQKYRFYAGESHRIEGQLSQSSSFFEECATAGPDEYFIRSIQGIFENMPIDKKTYFKWVPKIQDCIDILSKKTVINSTYYRLVAIGLMEMGEHSAKAIEYFDQSLAMNPNNIECLIGKAKCLFLLHSDNLKIIEEYLEQTYKTIDSVEKELLLYPSFLILISQIALQKSNHQEALFYAKAALKTSQVEQNKRNHFKRLQIESKYQIAKIYAEIPEKVNKCMTILQNNTEHAQSQWLLGTMHTDLEKARQQYEKAILLDSDFNPINLSIARLEMQTESRVNDAIFLFEKYFRKAEISDVRQRFELAECYKLTSQFQKASQYALLVLQKFPEDFKVLLFLGITHFEEKKYKQSLLFLNQADNMKKGCTEVLLFIGKCLDKLGEKQRAIDALQEAIKIDSKDPRLLCVIGRLYLAEGINDKGEQALKQCLIYDQNFEDALVELSGYNIERDIYFAKQLIEKCLQINPKNKSCIQQLMKLYNVQKDFTNLALLIANNDTEAEKDSSFMLDIAEKCLMNNKNVNLNFLKEILQKVVDYLFYQIIKSKKAASSCYDVKDENIHNEARSFLYLSCIAFIEKNYKLALQTIKKSEKSINSFKNMDKIVFYFIKAQIILYSTTNSDLEKVRTYFTRCLKYANMCQEEKIIPDKLDKFKLAARLNISSILMDENDIYKCIRSSNNILTQEWSQGNELSDIIRARVLIIEAQMTPLMIDSVTFLNKAKLIFKQILLKNPSNQISLWQLGEVYMKLNKQQKALKVLKLCIQYESTHLNEVTSKPIRQVQLINVHLQIATAQLNLSQIEQAIQTVRIVLSDFPDRLEPLQISAEIFFKVGQFEEAAEKASQVAASQRNNFRMLWIAGNSSLALHQPQRAIAFLKRCRQIDPQSSEIDILIAKAQENCQSYNMAIETNFQILKKNRLNEDAIQNCIRILTLLQQYNTADEFYLSTIVAFKRRDKTIPVNVQFTVALLEKRRGNLDKTKEMLRNIIEQDPLYAEAIFTLCTILFEENNFADITITCSYFFKLVKDLSIYPFSQSEWFPKIHNIYGNASAKMGDFSTSISQFQESLTYEPSNWRIMINIGISYIAMKQYQLALSIFQKAQLINKTIVTPWLFIAISQARLGWYPQAIKTYKKCLNIDSSFSLAAVNLSILLRRQGNPCEAIQCLLPIVAEFPNILTPSYHLALSYYESGESQNAIHLLQRMISGYQLCVEKTNFMPADTFLTVLPEYTLDIMFEDFSNSYQKRRLSAPSKTDLVLFLSRIYRSMNKIENELKVLESQLYYECEFNPVLEFSQYISQSRNSKVFKPNLDIFFKQDNSRTPLYLLALANEQHRAGMLEEELTILQECIKLCPTFVMAWDNLGSLYSFLNKRELSLQAFTKSVELNPASAKANYNLGNLQMQKSQIEAAIQSYEKSIQIDISNINAHFNLGIACEKATNPDISRAIQCYETCLKFDSSSNQIYLKKIFNLHNKLHQAKKTSF